MKEDLGHMKCFKCHEMGHHAYLCPHKKKAKKQRKQFARSAKSLVEVNELASKLETTLHGRVVCGQYGRMQNASMAKQGRIQ